MDLRKFHNALRILLNIDRDEFIGAGGQDVDWARFRLNPHDFFIHCSDTTAEGLFAVIEARQ